MEALLFLAMVFGFGFLMYLIFPPVREFVDALKPDGNPDADAIRITIWLVVLGVLLGIAIYG